MTTTSELRDQILLVLAQDGLEVIAGALEPILGELERMNTLIPANAEIADAMRRGEDATGLCTVRAAVDLMLEKKSDRMELFFFTGGKRVNVEIHITNVW